MDQGAGQVTCARMVGGDARTVPTPGGDLKSSIQQYGFPARLFKQEPLEELRERGLLVLLYRIRLL